ncbi:MAG: chloride channel protein [Pseudomonadota bacterium]
MSNRSAQPLIDLISTSANSVLVWARPNIAYALRKKQPLVWLLAMIIGVGTSLGAIAFRELIGAVQWTWLGTMTEQVASAARLLPWYVVLLVPTFGGLLVGLFLHYIQPQRRPLGVADVIEAKHAPEESLRFWPGVGSAIVSASSLGFGASTGREGPVVHLGATIAASVSRLFQLPRSSNRVLLACGVAGAVSASFNAPIAGVLFAHEVILGHYALSAFSAVVIASGAATIISRLYFGDAAAFVIPDYQITSFWEFPAFAILGLVCALVAVLFQYALIGTDYAVRTVRAPTWIRPAVGGLCVGFIGIWFPQVLGVGYQATDLALRNQLPLDLMLTLIFVKTVATAICLASRFGGGIFSPSLYIGAMTGGAFGLIAAGAVPEMASSQGLYAILGMGAVAAAVIGAPLSTTMIVFELTGGYALSIALLLTVSIASGISIAVHGRSYFHWQLESRGIAVADGPHSQLMRQVRVNDFLERLPSNLSERPPPLEEGAPRLLTSDTLERALRVFDENGLSEVPVVRTAAVSQVIGYARQVDALRHFNDALIDASIEEHK